MDLYESLGDPRGSPASPKRNKLLIASVSAALLLVACYISSGSTFSPNDNSQEMEVNEWTSSVHVESLYPDITLAIGEYGAVSGWSSFDAFPRAFADFNGDGYDDLYAFGQTNLFVSVSDGNGGFAPAVAFNTFCASCGYPNANTNPRIVADFNGDGLADIFGIKNDATCEIGINDGTTFQVAPVTCLLASGWTNWDQQPILAGDIDGDGDDDIVVFGNTSISLASYDGTNFVVTTSTLANFTVTNGRWTSHNFYPRSLADVNGDGKADIVGFGQTNVLVALADAGDFLTASAWGSFGVRSIGTHYTFDSYPRFATDIDGDGKADLVAFDYRSVRAVKSTGTAFQTVPFKLLKDFCRKEGWTTFQSFPRFVANFSGGWASLVGFSTQGMYVSNLVVEADELAFHYGCDTSVANNSLVLSSGSLVNNKTISQVVPYNVTQLVDLSAYWTLDQDLTYDFPAQKAMTYTPSVLSTGDLSYNFSQMNWNSTTLLHSNSTISLAGNVTIPACQNWTYTATYDTVSASVPFTVAIQYDLVDDVYEESTGIWHGSATTGLTGFSAAFASNVANCTATDV